MNIVHTYIIHISDFGGKSEYFTQYISIHWIFNTGMSLPITEYGVLYTMLIAEYGILFKIHNTVSA